MKHTFRNTLHTLLGFLGTLGAFCAFLMFTNPQALALPLLIIPSVLLGISGYYMVRTAQALLGDAGDYAIAIAVGSYLALLALLTSLNQLTLKDSLLAGLLFILAVFYYRRNIKQ